MHIAPDYRADLFVLPEGVYRRISPCVQKWEEADPDKGSRGTIWRARHHSSQTAPGNQVLGLAGERGGGKTWLLRYLAQDDRTVSPLAVYLDLGERTHFSDASQYVTAVEDQIEKRCGTSRAVLLLDAVPPYLDENLRALEKTILWPHLTQRGSLVIMALSHPLRVCWRIPALRGEERCLLPSFEEAQTNEQMRRLRKAKLAKGDMKAALMQEESGGLPLLNYLLATRDRPQSWRALLEYWLADVPPDDRDQVQTYLEVACPFDTLEHAKIQRALDIYNHHQQHGVARSAHPGHVRNTLQKYWLARPMTQAPGRIVLADSIQRATQEILKARDRALYNELKAIA